MTDAGGRVLSGWKEIAAYLRCSVKTARARARRRPLPVTRDGGAVYILREDVDMWIREGVTKTTPKRPRNDPTKV